MKTLNHTVLIFDTGVGGLSVYKQIYKILPQIHYIYIFDNYAFPFGDKKEHFIIQRLLSVINILIKIQSISLLVIACNSASTIVLPKLRKNFYFPIIGVVPAIKTAANITKNNIIGLLATKGTIKRAYTQKLIKKFAKNCQIIMLGTSELVNIVENKIINKIILLDRIKCILKPFMQTNNIPDTIVLGCTHFSFLRKEIKNILSNKVFLVDSNIAVADRVFFALKKIKPLLNTSSTNIAYYTKFTNTKKIKKLLQQYGFLKVQKLII